MMLRGLAGLYARGVAPDWETALGPSARARRAAPLRLEQGARLAGDGVRGGPAPGVERARHEHPRQPRVHGAAALGGRPQEPGAVVPERSPHPRRDRVPRRRLRGDGARSGGRGERRSEYWARGRRVPQGALHSRGRGAARPGRVRAGEPGRADPREERRSDAWTLHAGCRLSSPPEDTAPALDLAQVRERCQREMAHQEFYDEVAKRGFTFGPRFMGVETLFQGDGEALGRVRLPDAHALEMNGDRVHPALFDAGLQVLIGAVSSRDQAQGRQAARVPADEGRARRVASPGGRDVLEPRHGPGADAGVLPGHGLAARRGRQPAAARRGTAREDARGHRARGWIGRGRSPVPRGLGGEAPRRHRRALVRARVRRRLRRARGGSPERRAGLRRLLP